MNKKPKLTASQQNEAAFKDDFYKVYTFHAKFKKEEVSADNTFKGGLLYKMLAPILTRWWTVGAAISCTFNYYLVLFHACQTVIDVHSSTSAPNIIASKLYAMMKHQETFIDLTLIRCFHKAYVNPHFDWLQSCDDLSGNLGFSAHCIAVRFYVMHMDLRNTCRGRSMEDCHEAVANWMDGPITASERQRHLDKLNVFVGSVHESLCKHFPRWVNTSLLPAALLSEPPIAQVVAAVALGNSMPLFENDPTVKNDLRTRGMIDYKSEVHKVTIDLVALYRFLNRRLEHIEKSEIASDSGTCTPQALLAAQEIENGFDIRAKE